MKKLFTLYIVLLALLTGCTRDFLDTKPNTNLIIPQRVEDIEMLLDNTSINKTGGLGQMGADEYVFVDYAAWQGTFSATERNAYIWAKDIYEGLTNIEDWKQPYLSISFANNALKSLNDLKLPVNVRTNNAKGWALFIRAYAYADLLKNFCLAYDEATAQTDLGLPIRLSPAIDEIQPRANLADTYAQVINDLKQAAALLTPQFPEKNRNRPYKGAAYGMLARVYLSMNKYTDAEKYADSALNLYNKLIDYNTVSTSSATPFVNTNNEVIFQATSVSYSITANAVWNTEVTVNPDIINSYHPNDLRLLILFAKNPQGKYYVKTGYFGAGSYPFSGLAVNELYLIKAECLARAGKTSDAMQWLNNLLVKRFKNTVTYVPLTAANPDEATQIVLTERKKELIWRGLRWSDIKRLNKIGANIALKRVLNGKEYLLPPNDARYAYPIPPDEITYSNIRQNPR